jgi:hypothetical protein
LVFSRTVTPKAVRLGSAFFLIALVVLFSWTSRRWLLVGDASLMHYVVFLMERGMAPYRDIVDVNLPGTYAVEWAAIHLFGGSSLAWRLFDLVVCLGIGVAMTFAAWNEDCFAGPIAGALFWLLHGRDGMNELGQRDLVMTLLLMVSTAFLVRFVGRNRWPLVAIAGVVAGFAAIIKPSAALFWLAMLGYVCWRTKSRRDATAAGGAGLLSFLIAPVVAGFYLAHREALGSFWGIAMDLIPLHDRLLRLPTSYFLLHPLPASLIPVCLIWLVTVAMRLRRRTIQFDDVEVLLLIGLLCGLFSFYIQRKALPYHRYPADAYFVLLACVGFCKLLKSHSSQLRVIGAGGLLFCALIVGPQCFLKTLRLGSTPDDFSGLLQNDLQGLGGSALDGKVQCIDFTAGCVTTLYRMRLQQSTGFLYDCYLFQPDGDPAVARYRDAFWGRLVVAEPEVIVVSNHDCGHPNSFEKIRRWPQLSSFLEERYALVKEVHPPHEVRWASTAAPPYFYRIYERR